MTPKTDDQSDFPKPRMSADGQLLNKEYHGKSPFIVDLPIKNGDFPLSIVAVSSSIFLLQVCYFITPILVAHPLQLPVKQCHEKTTHGHALVDPQMTFQPGMIAIYLSIDLSKNIMFHGFFDVFFDVSWRPLDVSMVFFSMFPWVFRCLNQRCAMKNAPPLEKLMEFVVECGR